MQQLGPATSGHLALYVGNGRVIDAGGPTVIGGAPQNSSRPGSLPSGLGIVNSGLGSCQFSAYATATANPASLCWGFDGNGGAIIQYNGVNYPFPGSANANVAGPLGGVGADNAVLFNGTSGTALKDGGGPPFLQVANNTALKALPSGLAREVRRSGFAAAGDGGGADYLWSAAACTGVGDNGSQVQPNSGVGCWLLNYTAAGTEAAVFGVLPSLTDIGPSLQNAVNWACSIGTKILLRSGAYQQQTQVSIGNGSSSAQSTLNNCGIEGIASGASAIEMSPAQNPVTVKWTGTVSATAFVVNGPIAGPLLKGITVDCNSLCNTGFAFHYPIGGDFEHLMVVNWRGQAFVHDSYQAGVSGVLTGSQHNKFSDLRSMFPVFGTGASGIIIGPRTYGPIYDVAQNLYENSEFGFDDTTFGSCGITLQYTDNIIFTQVVTLPLRGNLPSAPGNGICINWPTGDAIGQAFPGSVSFFNSAIPGGVRVPDSAWSGNIGFWPWEADGGVPPTGSTLPSSFYGITDSGLPFGQRVGDAIIGNSGAARSFTSATTYIGSGGCNSANGFGCGNSMVRSGHMTSLGAGISNAGGTVTATMYVNNLATALTCQIISPATTCVDSVDSVGVTAGAFVSVRIDGDGSAPNSAVVTTSLKFDY